MPPYESVRPTRHASPQPAPVLLAVSGHALVAAAVPPYEVRSTGNSNGPRGRPAAWLRRLLSAGRRDGPAA
ncbi:hypothetical protein [Streptomyces sp. NPDC054863]